MPEECLVCTGILDEGCEESTIHEGTSQFPFPGEQIPFRFDKEMKLEVLLYSEVNDATTPILKSGIVEKQKKNILIIFDTRDDAKHNVVAIDEVSFMSVLCQFYVICQNRL